MDEDRKGEREHTIVHHTSTNVLLINIPQTYKPVCINKPVLLVSKQISTGIL